MRWGNAEALCSHRVLGFWPNTNILHRIQPGPRAPWGLVWLGDEEDERRSIGMDSDRKPCAPTEFLGFGPTPTYFTAFSLGRALPGDWSGWVTKRMNAGR